MKKILTSLMTIALFVSSFSSMAMDLSQVVNFDTKEEFFKDYGQKLKASKKKMKKILKKDDKFLEKYLGQHLVAFKNEQEDLLFDLGLDHVSTNREVINVMISDEAQQVIMDRLEATIEQAGGFDAFKLKIESVSDQKGVIASIITFFMGPTPKLLAYILLVPYCLWLLSSGIYN